MNRVIASALVAVGLAIGRSPASATVVMPPPPGPGDISMELQQLANSRVAPDAARRMHLALSAILVAGDYGSSSRDAGFNLLLRDQEGWTSWRSGKPRLVKREVGAELDRLLEGDTLWGEDGFVYGQPCPGSGRIMLAFHRGRDEVTRQLCGPQGLLGRLADMAATETVPPGPKPDAGGNIWSVRRVSYDGKSPTKDPRVAELLAHMTSSAAAAWNMADLEAHLAPYAEDVVIKWPDRRERGKAALRKRALAAQSWNGLPAQELSLQNEQIRELTPDKVQYRTTYHLNQRGALTGHQQFSVTSIWQKRRGKWHIVSEEIERLRPRTDS